MAIEGKSDLAASLENVQANIDAAAGRISPSPLQEKESEVRQLSRKLADAKGGVAESDEVLQGLLEKSGLSVDEAYEHGKINDALNPLGLREDAARDAFKAAKKAYSNALPDDPDLLRQHHRRDQEILRLKLGEAQAVLLTLTEKIEGIQAASAAGKKVPRALEAFQDAVDDMAEVQADLATSLREFSQMLLQQGNASLETALDFGNMINQYKEAGYMTGDDDPTLASLKDDYRRFRDDGRELVEQGFEAGREAAKLESEPP